LHVGLAQNDDRCAHLGSEEAFHGGKGHGLVIGDELALHVAGGEQLQDRRDGSDQHAALDEDAAVLFVALVEQIEGADRGHHEACGLDRAHHSVRILPQRPLVQNESPTPSIARVWPITPPAALEKAAQLVPNWNSMGMPVTTPTAKLMPKMRAQK
jgi:hypothetical protein